MSGDEDIFNQFKSRVEGLFQNIEKKLKSDIEYHKAMGDAKAFLREEYESAISQMKELEKILKKKHNNKPELLEKVEEYTKVRNHKFRK